MSSDSARRIRESIERSWAPFMALARKLEARLEEKTPAGWSAKEMLGTIAFWDEAAFGWITTGIRRQPLPDGWTFGSGYLPGDSWPRADEHNERESGWAKDRRVAEVLQRCDRAHEQLLRTIDTVTDEEAEKNPDYFRQLGEHYKDHKPELEALETGTGSQT